MSVKRGRIIVEYNDLGFKNNINKNNINIVYESTKNNYAIIYCDKQDEVSLLDILKKSTSINNCYIADERIDSYNF